MQPEVTVIIVNYNSMKKWYIIRQSLVSILSLKYRPINIIIVDNGSTDGSYEEIKKLIKKYELNSMYNIKIIKLSNNYGFAVANNIAFKLFGLNSKYLALINNDLVPDSDSLDKMIKILEKNPKIAAVQGKILAWSGDKIDSYGLLLADNGIIYAIANTLRPDIINKAIVSTAVDGAYSIYRVDALKKCGGLFQPYFFMWGDDYELGIRLWRCGYLVVAVPIMAGRHYRSATISNSEGKLPYKFEYWSWLSNVAVTIALYGHHFIIQLIRKLPLTLGSALLKKSSAIIRGFIDGIRIGFRLRKKLLNEYYWLKIPREPIVRVKTLQEIAFIIKLLINHGINASKLYYIILSRSLGKRYAGGMFAEK